jgi:hypothetical protein
MRPRISVCSFCFLGCVALFTAGRAQATDPPTSKTEGSVMTDKARQLYEEGLAAYKKERWAEARAALLAAWSLNKHWQIAGNLADCEIQLGRHRDAAEHASYYLRNAPPDRRQRAQGLLKKAQAKIGTLTVAVNEPGAEVLIDDVSVGRVPLAEPVFVEPGKRMLLARFAGRPDAVQTIDVTPGMANEVTLTLRPPAAPPPPLPPPPHTPAEVQGRKPNMAILVGGAVAAGLALSAGVVLAAVSSSKAADADDQLAKLRQAGGGPHPCRRLVSECKAIDSAWTARDSLADGAVVSFVGAGALAAATVAYGLLAPSFRSAKPVGQMRVLPAVTALQGGVVVLGVW